MPGQPRPHPGIACEVSLRQEELLVRRLFAQRQQEEAATQSIRPMSEDERDELLYDMKVKWGKLNEAYGKLSFTLDVPSHMRRKEELEAEMTQLEKDIKTLQGRQVVVVDERRV